MKAIFLTQWVLLATVAAWAADAPDVAPSKSASQAQAATGDSDSFTSSLAVGETLPITLPCNPTTGYQWVLKRVDRKIAVPVGKAEYQQAPAGSGRLGGGGNCVLTLKGVKAGKTKAVLVYRGPGGKGEIAKTFTVHLTVLPKTSHS